MRKLLIVAAIAGLAYWVGQRSRSPVAEPTPAALADSQPAHSAPAAHFTDADTTQSFHCDGRKYCSQMKSCDEAEFFLAHCPDVKMDGDRDGAPCENMCGNR